MAVTASMDSRDYILKVDSIRGSPTPAVGTNLYAWRSTATCSAPSVVISGISWRCAGWSGTGSIPASGTTNTTGVVELSELESSITWNWETAFEVTNVAAAQRPGTKLVDITYDIVSDIANAVPISFAVTHNGTPVTATNLSGDHGANVLPGANKVMVWDAGTDWNGNLATLDFFVRHTTATQIVASGSASVDTRDYSITTVSLPVGAIGTPYHFEMQAAKGTPPYTWTIMKNVVAWGRDNFGQSTVPPEVNNLSAISAGTWHSLGIKPDGTVLAWGNNGWGQTTIPAGVSNVTSIAGGWSHSLALRSNGTVVAWGETASNQTAVPAGLSNITAIAGGNYHSLALKSDRTVVAWGTGSKTVPADVSNVDKIAGGGWHSLGLKTDGTVVAWGYNYHGQTDVPAGLSGVTTITAGESHSLALKLDQTVVAWGQYFDGTNHAPMDVPVGLSNVTAIAAGWYHNLALKSDGTVAAWGNNEFGQTTVPTALNRVTAIAGGGYHSLALRSPETQLPNGMTLSPSGVLSGTPTRAGTNWITFVLQDSAGATLYRELAIVVP